jgi:hypothetical protein
MARIILQIIITALTISSAISQDPTDVYLFQLQISPDHSCHIYQPKFLSGFNRGGYTNQPWFVSNEEILLSVRMRGDTQNDIYLLSLPSKKVRQITRTNANEYSPRIHPEGQHLSMVRQVAGDSIDQQVFQATWPAGGECKSITPRTKNIGYYSWINKDELALFRLEGETNRLWFENLKDHRTRQITSSIGRTLLADKSGAMLYVHKFNDDYWYIKKYYSATGTIDIIVQTPGKSEDFAIAPDGTYIMGVGEKLYSFHPVYQPSWKEIADLSIYGIQQITRLTVSPDGKQLALVSTK